MTLPRRAVPLLGYVRQQLPSDYIADPHAETLNGLVQSGLLGRLNKGDKIAITAGSRGMRASVDLLTGIVEAVRHFGGDPFIIPATGSHGGAAADGQVEILKRLGITEETIDEMWLSAPLLSEAARNSNLTVDGSLSPFEFDNAGNLF